MFPSALFGTQPVELFGRIGSRTWYQVWPALTSSSSRIRTTFCVPSLVSGSFVTTYEEALGLKCAPTGRTTAQWPIFAFVSVAVREGILRLLCLASPWGEAPAVGSAASAASATSASSATRQAIAREERGAKWSQRSHV